jgi:hypothetical protein
MDLRVHRGTASEAWFIDSVFDVVGHRLGGIGKDGGFVHIVPESGNSVGDKFFVKRAPPVARRFLGEVRKNGRTRPDRADVILPLLLNEVVSCFAGIVRSIVLVGGVSYVEVSDDDGVKLLRSQLMNKAGKAWEGYGIDRKWSILVLEIDV